MYDSEYDYRNLRAARSVGSQLGRENGERTKTGNAFGFKDHILAQIHVAATDHTMSLLSAINARPEKETLDCYRLMKF